MCKLVRYLNWATEQSILGIKLTERVRNTTIRSKIKITDINCKADTFVDDQRAKFTTLMASLNGKRHRSRF